MLLSLPDNVKHPEATVAAIWHYINKTELFGKESQLLNKLSYYYLYCDFNHRKLYIREV